MPRAGGASSWAMPGCACAPSTRAAPPRSGTRAISSMPPAATPSSPGASASSGASAGTTAPPCTRTFAAPGASEDPRRAGDISIFWFEHGWFWFIPLADGMTSVGVVVWPYYMKRRAKPVREYFLDTIAQSPALAERLAHAELATDVEATGNYSYRCTRPHGEALPAGRRCVRVHRSGVLLRRHLRHAGRHAAAAEALDQALRQPARRAGGLPPLRAACRATGRAPSPGIIYRMTRPAMQELFMDPRNLAAGARGAAVAPRRRHLRRDAHLGIAARIQDALLPGLAADSAALARRRCAGARATSAPAIPSRRRQSDETGAAPCGSSTSTRRRPRGRWRRGVLGAARSSTASRGTRERRAAISAFRSAQVHDAGARRCGRGAGGVAHRRAGARRAATAACVIRAAARSSSAASPCTRTTCERPRPRRWRALRPRRAPPSAPIGEIYATLAAAGNPQSAARLELPSRHQHRDARPRALPAIQHRAPRGARSPAAAPSPAACRPPARSAPPAAARSRSTSSPASRAPAFIENPRQVSAYRYPARVRAAQPRLLAGRGARRQGCGDTLHLRHGEHRRPPLAARRRPGGADARDVASTSRRCSRRPAARRSAASCRSRAWRTRSTCATRGTCR